MRLSQSRMVIDITPDMPKLCRVTKVQAFFLCRVLVFNFNLFESPAAILEKGIFSALLDISTEEAQALVDVNYGSWKFPDERKYSET